MKTKKYITIVLKTFFVLDYAKYQQSIGPCTLITLNFIILFGYFYFFLQICLKIKFYYETTIRHVISINHLSLYIL